MIVCVLRYDYQLLSLHNNHSYYKAKHPFQYSNANVFGTNYKCTLLSNQILNVNSYYHCQYCWAVDIWYFKATKWRFNGNSRLPTGYWCLNVFGVIRCNSNPFKLVPSKNSSSRMWSRWSNRPYRVSRKRRWWNPFVSKKFFPSFKHMWVLVYLIKITLNITIMLFQKVVLQPFSCT